MRSSSKDITVTRTTSATDFQAVSVNRVAAAPVIHSVIATTLAHAIETPSSYPGSHWYWARKDGRIAALAMHTPPRPFHVATVDPQLARAFALRAMVDRLEIRQVGGLVSGALAFAETLAFQNGARIRVSRREGMHDLPGPPKLPTGVPGVLRPAHDDEVPLVESWARAYLEETGTERPPRFPLREWVSAGSLQVWEVDGRPVSMAHASRPHGGVSRISWIYTPAEERGHGYAAATLAGVSLQQRRQGRRCLLYTDLDHAGSAKLYRRVGYRKVGDSCVLSLEQMR